MGSLARGDMYMASGESYVILAAAIANVAHTGTSRKGDGEPYINHVSRVAMSQRLWRRRTIGYLHDVVEDTNVNENALRTMFPGDLVDDVMLLTRVAWLATPVPGHTYSAYIDRICEDGSEDALQVKLADLNDNLRDVTDFAPGMERRYQKARMKILDELEARWKEEEARKA